MSNNDRKYKKWQEGVEMFTRKNAKQDLNKPEKQDQHMEKEFSILKGIQSAMPDPYYVRDMDCNIILWPESIQNLTGYSEKEAKQMKCGEIFKAVVCKDCPTTKCVKEGKFLKDAQVDVFHKNGKRIVSLVSNAGIYDENGTPIGAVEIVKDNTKYRNVIETVSEKSEQISAVSEELAASSQEVSALSNRMNGQAGEIVNATKNGLDVAKNVNEKAKECSDFTVEVKNNIDSVGESMKSSVNKMNDLREKSEAIINIVSTIQGITSQTNLLALNASIEAARAGEAGKGFAVVADEIRKLAESSSKSTKEIQKTINEMISIVQETFDFITNTDSSLESGISNIEQMSGLISGMSTASTQMLAIMDQIEKVSIDSAEISSHQNNSMEEIAASSQDLAGIAQTLQRLFEEKASTIQHDKM